MLAQTAVFTDGPLAVEESRYGDEVLVISVAGELDGAVVATASRHLKAALEGPCRLVVVDLTEVEFLDSAAIALLYGLAELRSGPEALRVLPSRHPEVNRILALTDVGSVLPVVVA